MSNNIQIDDAPLQDITQVQVVVDGKVVTGQVVWPTSWVIFFNNLKVILDSKQDALDVYNMWEVYWWDMDWWDEGWFPTGFGITS